MKTINNKKPLRVLYSYPHKLGASRICFAAWQHVKQISVAGAMVLAYPGVLNRSLPPDIKVFPTMALGKFRISYRLLGTIRACALHDFIVSRSLEKIADQVDIVHTWPLGALNTLKTAAKLGIPTVLERPNAHTKFAYEAVEAECIKLGIKMPKGHEHAYNKNVLIREEEEYKLATKLLCPSNFVARTFLNYGFPRDKLARHQYGYDESLHFATDRQYDPTRGLSMIFVGGCAPRKGLHYALEAWLKSPAHENGQFRVIGEFVPGYAEKLAPMLEHPSVNVLGFRTDYAEIMRTSDILILPSIEEGSALVTYDARANGNVLLVSNAAGAICTHMENALVHTVGDVNTLAQHIAMLHEDRELLEKLRTSSLSTVSEITWEAAGKKLLQVYRETTAI